MERNIYIEIPINRMGLYGMTENVSARDDKNIKVYEFTCEEEALLWPLFNEFNDAFYLFIDDFEEEMMLVKQLPEAINITQHFIANVNDAQIKETALKVLEALEFAQKLQMPVEFIF